MAVAWTQDTSKPVPGTDGYAHWSPWGGDAFDPKIEGVPQNPALGVVVPTFLCPSDPGPAQASVPYKSTRLLVAFTHYQGVSGTNYTQHDGILAANHNVRIADIKDGTSNTLIAGERSSSKSLEYGIWFAGCGQYGASLPEGDRQRGSADVVLGVREINSGYPYGSKCPKGPDNPYHFTPPGQIKDIAGKFSDDCDQFHFWSWHPGGANFVFADGAVRFLSYEVDNIMPALGTRSGGEVVQIP